MDDEIPLPPTPVVEAVAGVERGEVVIGLVGALGTDLELVERLLKGALLRVA